MKPARLSLLALVVAAACEGTQSYVYSAQKYDTAGDCLASDTAVETVNAAGANSTCPPSCLMVGADLYVSRMCPPLPAIATAVPDDAGDCIPALAAAARGGTCDEPADAGPEEAGEDAAEDSSSADAEPDAEDIDASDGAVPITDATDEG